MLAQLAKPSRGFRNLAAYLVRGKAAEPDPKRVAWILARNIATEDPMLAAAYMAATAALSCKCRTPCYHAMIAWHPEERPDHEIMQAIAIRTLELAGLGEHQAFIMGHGDTGHPHLHMMINRIHPVTGKAWSTAHDWRRFDKIMKELAEAHGFRTQPAHAFNPELTDHLPRQPRARAWRAARYGAPTARIQWSNCQAALLADLFDAKLPAGAVWEDLAHLAERHALSVEAKGPGHVVGNARGYVKLSALGLQAAAKGALARTRVRRSRPLSAPPERQAERPPDQRPRPWVDRVDVARALAAWGLAPQEAVRRAIADARAVREERLARASLMTQLRAELARQFRSSTAHKPPRKPGRQLHRSARWPSSSARAACR